jgi:hypothetical protein
MRRVFRTHVWVALLLPYAAKDGLSVMKKNHPWTQTRKTFEDAFCQEKKDVAASIYSTIKAMGIAVDGLSMVLDASTPLNGRIEPSAMQRYTWDINPSTAVESAGSGNGNVSLLVL